MLDRSCNTSDGEPEDLIDGDQSCRRISWSPTQKDGGKFRYLESVSALFLSFISDLVSDGYSTYPFSIR